MLRLQMTSALTFSACLLLSVTHHLIREGEEDDDCDECVIVKADVPAAPGHAVPGDATASTLWGLFFVLRRGLRLGGTPEKP